MPLCSRRQCSSLRFDRASAPQRGCRVGDPAESRPSGIDRAARSGQPGIYVMAAELWRNPAVTRGWRACNITRKLSYLPL